MTSARADGRSSGGTDPTTPERPAEAVELCELLYRRIFSSGLLVVTIMAAYAAGLSAIRPEPNHLRAVAVSVVLFVIAATATLFRQQLYGKLRRHPWGIAIPAAIVGAGAWAMGFPNDQAFYVITLTLGVTGLTVPFWHVFLATVIAGAGCTAPALLSTSPHVTSSAIAAITIPTVFWLIIEQLARYVLRAYGETGVDAEEARGTARVSADPGPPPSPSGAGHRPAAIGGRLQRLLPRRVRRRRDPVQLSARQLEVLMLAAEGLKDAEIGACLEIGEQQVRRHLRQARERTGSPTSYALMAWALRHELIPTARTSAS